MMNDLKTIDIFDSDGTYSVREVFRIVFYIREKHQDIGDQIEKAIFRFGHLVSFENLRYYSDAEGDWQDLLKQDLSQWLEKEYDCFAGTVNATIILRGKGKHPPDFFLRYSGLVAVEEGYSAYFQCSVPKEYWLEHRNELLKFADELATSLPFSFGYASLGALDDEYGRCIQKLAGRYCTIDVADIGSVKLDIGEKASGSYWLNYLGKDLAEALHGIDELQKALPEKIAIDRIVGDKYRLQLGQNPIQGDVNHQEDVSLYQALASYFDSCGVLHVPERCVYFKDDKGMTDREAQEKWHRRFLDTY